MDATHPPQRLDINTAKTVSIKDIQLRTVTQTRFKFFQTSEKRYYILFSAGDVSRWTKIVKENHRTWSWDDSLHFNYVHDHTILKATVYRKYTTGHDEVLGSIRETIGGLFGKLEAGVLRATLERDTPDSSGRSEFTIKFGMNVIPSVHSSQPLPLAPSDSKSTASQPTQPPPALTGVTFSPGPHPANPFTETTCVPSSKILQKSCPDLFPFCKQMLFCSLGETSDIIPQRNGFVHTVLECYNNHRALILRPDDIWIAILTQFYCFVNGHAEELRSLFVLHDGKRELTMVVQRQDPRAPVDMDSLIGMFAENMSQIVQENIVDPELRSWMLPAFSTTTRADLVTSASIMLGTVKEYFSFRIMLLCGIPRVTLLGEKSDWERILNRIEKLKEYGSNTVAWYHLLHPILSRFVRAFDEPCHPDNLDFWSKVANLERFGSGPTWLSGWITAFMMFNENGKWMGDANKRGDGGLVLDGVTYPMFDEGTVPAGYAQLDIELQLGEKGESLPTTLIAGFIGTRIQGSGDKALSVTGERDTAAPAIAWWWSLKSANQSDEPMPTTVRDDSECGSED